MSSPSPGSLPQGTGVIGDRNRTDVAGLGLERVETETCGLVGARGAPQDAR
jgi:hypothetical protein